MDYTLLRNKLDFEHHCDEIINEAKEFAKELSENDLTSQLRKFYGEVKRLQLNGYNKVEFKLLKPKLAYAAGRNQKILKFYEVMSDAIDKVDNQTSFDNFVKMFEAIIAYHKFYKKENKNN